MPSLSYQEKSLCGELAADLAVFVPYFIFIHVRHPTVSFIAGAIALLIVVQIILQSIIAIVSRNRMKDERDRLIQLRGYRAAYFTIVFLMIFGMGLLWGHTLFGALNPAHLALYFLSVFFAVLMLAEVAKTGTQLVAYRRSL